MDELYEGLEISQEQKDLISGKVEKLLSEEKAKANVNANRILDSVGSQISEKYGVERLASETKITDYINRAVNVIGENSLKSAESVLTEKEQKIAELTAKIESSGDDALKSEFEKLKELYNGTLTEKQTLAEALETEKSNYENQLIELKQNSIITRSLPNLSEAKETFGSDFVDFKVNQAIEEIKAERNLIIDENNKLIGEHKENYTKAFIDELLKEKLKDIADSPVVGGNAGESGNKKPITNVVFTKNMDGVKKDEIVTSNLIARGFSQSDIKGWALEYQKTFQEAAKNMK